MQKKSIKILTAFDGFKDSLCAKKVGMSVQKGILKHNFKKDINFSFSNIPLSDGGDGFVNSLQPVLNDIKVDYYNVTGPFPTRKKVKSKYLIWKNEIAIIELALTSGIEMVETNERNAYNTTTSGLGELILFLYKEKGIKKILLGVGGSSTNDAGLGALKSMGLEIFPFEKNHKIIGKDLFKITKFQKMNGKKLIPDLEIDIACDVENPFCGKNGAPMVYGKQKGLSKEQQIEIDNKMKELVSIIQDSTDKNIEFLKGAGAAGGIPGPFNAFQNARLKPGIELFAEYVNLEQNIKESDLIFSGEGCYDYQTTKHGKTVSYVEKLCKKYQKPLIIICGKNLVENQNNVYELLSMFNLEQSMKETDKCIVDMVDKKIINEYKFFSEFIK